MGHSPIPTIPSNFLYHVILAVGVSSSPNNCKAIVLNVFTTNTELIRQWLSVRSNRPLIGHCTPPVGCAADICLIIPHKPLSAGGTARAVENTSERPFAAYSEVTWGCAGPFFGAAGSGGVWTSGCRAVACCRGSPTAFCGGSGRARAPFCPTLACLVLGIPW